MSDVPVHSKARLALAVITSPGPAFEEILQRKMLGTGFVFVLAAGTLSSIAAILRAVTEGPLEYFSLGHYNPVAWLGLFLLYALALWKLLKWLGTEIELVDLLIVMGWAQIALAASQLLMTIGWALVASGSTDTAAQIVQALGNVLQLAYVAAIAAGIRVKSGVPLFRGVLSYIVVTVAASMGFAFLYARSRVDLFAGALPGIQSTAGIIAVSDTTPWLGASVIGLGLGTWHLANALSWDTRTRIARTAAACLVGVIAFGGYLYPFSTTDYYGRLIAAQRDYDNDRFTKAAVELRTMLPISKQAAGNLAPTIAGLYLLAKEPDLSISYYKKLERNIRSAASNATGNIPQLAFPLAGIGAAYDQQGRYETAIKQFKAAAKAMPESPDPWVRLGVTYARTGNYGEAIKTAKKAIKLDPRSAVASVVLAQAYTATGDKKKSATAIKAVSEADEDLAKRITKSPGGWKRAVSALTPNDLGFPLEKQPVMPPKQTRVK